MYGRGPSWGSVVVTGLAGFSIGLLVAALLVAGRTPPRPVQVGGSEPAASTPARPATITLTSVPPAPSTVTEQILSPPDTMTSYVEVTILPPTTTSTPTTTSPPTTTITRLGIWGF